MKWHVGHRYLCKWFNHRTSPQCMKGSSGHRLCKVLRPDFSVSNQLKETGHIWYADEIASERFAFFRWLWLSICLSSWHLESIVLLRQEGQRERESKRERRIGHCFHRTHSLSVPPIPGSQIYFSTLSCSWVTGNLTEQCAKERNG